MKFRSVDSALAEALECDRCVGAERWYIRKHRWIGRRAKAHGVSMDEATTVYALLSMNKNVAENDRLFEEWIDSGRVFHFGMVERRVRLAERGDIGQALTFKNGFKVTTFADNLRRPWAFAGATIDRHAGDVITGDRSITKRLLARVRGIGYRWLERQYVKAARRARMLPSGVQARVWVHHVSCLGNGAS